MTGESERYVFPDEAGARRLFDEICLSGEDLRRVVEQELADWAPDFLPHIVMPCVADRANELANLRDPSADTQIAALLDVLERWFAAGTDDDPVVNVIGVSFLEHITPRASYPRLRDLIEPYPALHADLQRWLDY